MKCPACEERGLKSRLFMDGGGSTTLMGWSPFYDEEGVYHSHNPNRHSSGAECSNGHRIGYSSYSSCPAGDYEREEIVRVSFKCDACKYWGKDEEDGPCKSRTCDPWCDKCYRRIADGHKEGCINA